MVRDELSVNNTPHVGRGAPVRGRRSARGPRVAGETQSLAQRAREHRYRGDRANPENERPLDQVAESALEPGLEPREPYLHLLPQLGDVRTQPVKISVRCDVALARVP